MKAAIERASKWELEKLVSDWPMEESAPFLTAMSVASVLRKGKIDGELVCIWGLIPPTLLSDKAYLWLWTSPKLKGNEFIFVRHSQLAIAEILEKYPIIIGHTKVSQKQSIKWLKWLGAQFGDPVDGFIPFWIEKNGKS